MSLTAPMLECALWAAMNSLLQRRSWRRIWLRYDALGGPRSVGSTAGTHCCRALYHLSGRSRRLGALGRGWPRRTCRFCQRRSNPGACKPTYGFWHITLASRFASVLQLNSISNVSVYPVLVSGVRCQLRAVQSSLPGLLLPTVAATIDTLGALLPGVDGPIPSTCVRVGVIVVAVLVNAAGERAVALVRKRVLLPT